MLRYIYLGLFLAGLAFLIYYTLRELVGPIAWAAIFAYATWPLHALLYRWFGGRGGWSAFVMVFGLGSLLVAPLIGLTAILQGEIVDFFRQLPAWLEGKPELPSWVAGIPFVGGELQTLYDQVADLQGLLREQILPRLSGVSGKLLGMLEGAGFLAAKLLFTLFLMFFFYRDGRAFVSQIRQGLVLGLGERAHDYLATVEVTTKAVVYGIVLTAIAQGAVAGLGYWGVGMRAPVLLALVTAFVAMIPFGTPVVWGGASLWLLFHGEHWAGIGLFLWGALVVSWVDNVIRPLVISRNTRIPFVVVMLGVLGGLASFGFIGLFLGPVILAVGLAAWREWLRSKSEAVAEE